MNLEELNAIEKLKEQANSFEVPVKEGAWEAIANSIDSPKGFSILKSWWSIPTIVIVISLVSFWFVDTQSVQPALIASKKANVSSSDLVSGLENGGVNNVSNNEMSLVKNDLSNLKNTPTKFKVVSDGKTETKWIKNSTVRQETNLISNGNKPSPKLNDNLPKKRVLSAIGEEIKLPSTDSERLKEKETSALGIVKDQLVSSSDTANSERSNNPLRSVNESKSKRDSQSVVNENKDDKNSDELNNEIKLRDTGRNEITNQASLVNQQSAIAAAVVPRDDTGTFSLIVATGVGYSHRFLQSELDVLLVQHKNSHEKGAFAYNFSLLGQFDISRSFIRAGVVYSSYGERYSFSNEQITHNTTNRYNYLQIPVSYGRKLYVNNRFGIAAEAGLKLSLLNLAQSSWVDPLAMEPISHSSLDAQQPFTTKSFTYFVGLDFSYKIANKIDLHVMPTFDSFVNSVYQNSSALNQKQYGLIMRIGASYRF